MLSIIQDFGKIINNRITKLMIVYITMISLLCLGFMIGRLTTLQVNRHEVKIIPKDASYDDYIGSDMTTQNSYDLLNATGTTLNNFTSAQTADKSVIFASSKGKYFYYKGCGGTTISKKNLVYYASEQKAIAAGKVLYSKCK